MRTSPADKRPAPRAHWLRISLRGYIGIVVACSLLFAYTGNYYRLSRRGMEEARKFGLPGFLYVPFEQAAASENLTRHYALASFYSRLNWIDRAVFGAPSPVICLMWRLSG